MYLTNDAQKAPYWDDEQMTGRPRGSYRGRKLLATASACSLMIGLAGTTANASSY